MKNSPTTSAASSDVGTILPPVIGPEQGLKFERLCVVAKQTRAEMGAAILVLLGYLILFRDQLEVQWMVCAATIAAAYLARLALAIRFIRARPKHLGSWYRRFVIIALINGISWGLFVSLLILSSGLNMDPYISVLIVGLTLVAIYSLGALLSAYVAHTLGIILPIATTLTIRDSGFDTSLASMILVYAVTLLVIVANFYRQLDAWLRLASENAELANRLRNLADDKRQSDLAWIELENRLQQLMRQIQ